MSLETVVISSILEVSVALLCVCFFLYFVFILYVLFLHLLPLANVEKTLLCSQTLTTESVKEFKTAINNLYWYQMYLDDLPLWGMVGLKQAHEHVCRKEMLHLYLLYLYVCIYVCIYIQTLN